jgi:ATP-dependent Clp protease ATP-binding subunit ClpA
MFERYTEKARRVIFFARYEASLFGTSEIEAEHILLGLTREDKVLCRRFFGAGTEQIRRQVEARTTPGQRVSTSVDLPLSDEAKGVLAFAAEEAERLKHRHIGTEHLLLGLLREEHSMAAEILRELGLRVEEVRARVESRDTTEVELSRARFEAQITALGGEVWASELLAACLESGWFTPGEMAEEFQHVAALREFSAATEALLRLMAAKGAVDLTEALALALRLHDEHARQDFIATLRRKRDH